MPVKTFSAPVFVNGRLIAAVPALVERWNVPALLNATAAPPLYATTLLFWRSKLPAADWFHTAPFCRNTPPVAAAASTAAPLLFSVRVSSVTVAVVIMIPPLAVVVPLPDIVPPVHVISPPTVKLPAPVSVPESIIGPVSASVSPPLIVSIPASCNPATVFPAAVIVAAWPALTHATSVAAGTPAGVQFAAVSQVPVPALNVFVQLPAGVAVSDTPPDAVGL